MKQLVAMRPSSGRKLRLPVRFVDGTWELASGGAVPVAEGQVAELIVPEHAVTDPTLLREMKSRSAIKILDRGTKIRAYLATKDFEGVTDDQRGQLVSWPNWLNEIVANGIESWNTGKLSFFELMIGPATEKQARDLTMRGGGLWLEVEGRQAKGLISSQFELPDCVSPENAISLNHAFTILSEVYEPWRKSHTGNAYDRFLYQEENGLWYPLSLLRDSELAQEDQKIAQRLWLNFLARMSPVS